MNIKVYYSGKMPIELQAESFTKLANKIEGENKNKVKSWTEIYDKLGADYFYSFTVVVGKEKPDYEEIWFDDSWLKDDIPLVNYSKISKVSSNYNVTTDKNASIIIGDEVKEFLDKIDGEKNLFEIVESMSFNYKIKYSGNEKLDMILKYMNLCAVLEREGVMSKR